jgi:tRNA-dihydrouridine synthase B
MAPLTLRGVVFDPPLFCAPMAGISHSAFRRLLSDFGGYGALYTEMLSGKNILNHEDPHESPWLKRRPAEGRVVYQLLLSDTKGLPELIDRLAPLAPDAIDLNAACNSTPIRKRGGGASLFGDLARLREIVRGLRTHFPGPLLTKIRLGDAGEGWQDRLRDRLHLFEDEGVDAVVIHTRFRGEKLGRSARPDLYRSLVSDTRLPVIANGDIDSPDFVADHAADLASVRGLMIGRPVAACPWLFGHWHDPLLAIDRPAVWHRLCDYLLDDFTPAKALMRLKIVTSYFSRNFFFGHSLFVAVQDSPDIATARERAQAFFAKSPRLTSRVDLAGV